MDFSLRCAYAHGTSALRTHLINMSPKQTQLTWPAFSRLRKKWAGKVGSGRSQAWVGVGAGWGWGWPELWNLCSSKSAGSAPSPSC